MKLGKKPARPDAIRLRLSTYLDFSKLPTPPLEFGHDSMVRAPWQMLGNDQWGDCVWAGAAHETMLFNAAACRVVPFSGANVLSDYSAVTGFNPNDPNTDQGTDMQAAAAYRQKVGVLDARGYRHKVGAYLALEKGNLHQHLVAAYVFGAVGLGIEVPDSAQDQFGAGQPWRVVPGSSIEGGHYVPMVARRGGMSVVVTWGREQLMGDDFFAAYNDESVVYLSSEMLMGGRTLEGFNLAQLTADLAALRAA